MSNENNRYNHIHSVIDVPITAIPGGSLPLLVLKDGQIFNQAAMYARQLQRQGYSSSKIRKAVMSIGLLYDLHERITNGKQLTPSESRMLLEKFAESRLYGSIEPQKWHAKDLEWQDVRFQTAKQDIQNVRDFGRFCTDNFGYDPICGMENYTDVIRKAFETSMRRKTSLLFHLNGPLSRSSAYRERELFRSKNRVAQTGQTIPKSFPCDKVDQLIDETNNIRDKLCILLQAKGSPRTSELMHLYLSDVSLNRRDGTAKIVLGHPSDSPFLWIDKKGTKKTGTRRTYLKEMYGLIPRNQYGEKHPLHAGWKGMLYDDKSRLESEVYWLDIEAGRLFYQLHKKYVMTIRKNVPNIHPYYLVSTNRDSFGEPLKIKNYQNQFSAACRRIGLDSSDEGSHPHGLRHYYGYYCVDQLRMRVEDIQIAMHHVLSSSTQVYLHVRTQTIRDVMGKAQNKMKREKTEQEFKDFLAIQDHD
jgi:integrase